MLSYGGSGSGFKVPAHFASLNACSQTRLLIRSLSTILILPRDVFRMRNVRRQVPRFEYVCVNGFACVVLIETCSQIVCATGISLVGMSFVS
jgi:hypothetical protein